jgi:hypothetical protein
LSLTDQLDVLKKNAAGHKSWGGPDSLGPLALKSWGDASHGSHRVVAPMVKGHVRSRIALIVHRKFHDRLITFWSL